MTYPSVEAFSVAKNQKINLSPFSDIRAAQGHTIDCVSIQHVEKEPPEFLYHGTATRFIDSIRQFGLIAGSRHHVHLSQDISTAITVGRRHGKPVVLKIEALKMHQEGFKFYQADNGVWLTNSIPASKLDLDASLLL
ncbi:RNA 2'-phosphotransferase [Pseudomonas sp. Tri1]|uniref:RNA 2'-phosphotransferase n=1 Tax=Pseudomonas sp. Tri1 TaxID=2823875 RepID=UPI001B318F33